MSALPELPDELVDLGKAVGLLDASGLDDSWFDTPIDKLRTILSDVDQRTALLALLDKLLPPDTSISPAPNEKWHALLGPQPLGNVYLTVSEQAGGVTVGIAGHFGVPPLDGSITAQLSASLPLVKAAAAVQAIAGSAEGPLALDLRVDVGWQRPAQAIGLAAMRFTVRIADDGVDFSLLLEQLQLDDGAPRDVLLDPHDLGEEALQLVLGLVKRLLQEAAGGAEAQALKDHLLPLLGLAGAGIPPLPLAQLGRDPAAVQKWLAQMLEPHSPPPIMAWLGHLAGLLGGPGSPAQGSGSETDPWRVVFVPFAGGEGLALTVFRQDDALCIGVLAAVLPGVVSNPGLRAGATIARIPLGGTARAKVLPAASIALRAPATGVAPLIDSGPFATQALVAGVRWDGSALVPQLELQGVRLDTTTYPKIDLTNTDSVAEAAKDLVAKALKDALGNGAGEHLAALAGLIAPAGDNASPHRVDLAQLFGNPAQAIGRFHRAVLLDATHNWSFLLQEVAALIGLTAPIAGAGSATDPWRMTIASSGAIELALAAWNAAAAPGDPQQLRIGLVARASAGSMTVQWFAELLAFDLPDQGAGAVRLLGGQHLSFRVAPGPRYTSPEGIDFAADSLEAHADWQPGAALAWKAGIAGLHLGFGTESIDVPSLAFPAAFDVGDPAALAAGFGVSVAQIESLLKHLIARAASSWGGLPGFVVAALTGVHGNLQGLQDDWPTLADVGGAGSLLSDPGPALRDWLDRLVTQVSADGSPFLPRLLPLLRTLLDGSLQATVTDAFDGLTSIVGDGTYDSPWVLPLGAGSRAPQALAWLEPAGPPANWAGALATAAGAAVQFVDLVGALRRLAAFHDGIAAAIAGSADLTVAGMLDQLATHLAGSDGVVPVAAQTPTGASWTSGAPVNAAHPLLPHDAGAIAQILTQIDALVGGAGGSRCVLYIGPAFADRTAWATLLADPARHGSVDPAANFALRQPGVDPLTIGLDGVTAAVDHYTAELADDGSGDDSKLTAQIDRIVARLNVLRPGQKITLVAHSTAGLPARAYTAANPARIRGLITLGSPHLGAPLPFLSGATMGSAVRIVQGLRASLPASPIRDAIDHLIFALDGHAPPPAAGDLPKASPYPVASFVGTPVIDTAGVPALAIPGRLGGTLLDALKSAAGTIATAAAGEARPAPTHLCFGLAAALDVPPAQADEIAVDVRLRANLLRLALRGGVADPPRPAQSLRLRIALDRPGGWIAGGPGPTGASGDALRDVRVRRAELGLDVFAGNDGKLTGAPFVHLVQAGLRGPLDDVAHLGDPVGGPLLGAVMHALSLPQPAANSPAGALLAVLQALGLAVGEPGGAIGFSADALAALQSDAVSFLAPRLRAALNAGQTLLGTAGPPGGPSQFAVPALPLRLTVQQAPWRIGLASTGDGLDLGGNVRLSLDAALSLPGMTGSLDARFAIGGLTLAFDGSQLSVAAAPWLDPLQLHPPPADLRARLNDALPRLLFSSAAGTLLEALLGPEARLGPLDNFLRSTGAFLQAPSALGSPAGGFDGDKVNGLLGAIAGLAGLGAGPGLPLPGNLRLTAGGAGTDASPLNIQLATTSPLGGALSIALSAGIDHLRHVSPAGTLSLAVPLSGTWPHVSVDFGVDAKGIALSVTPQGQPAIRILPSFSGLGALRGAAEALLPQALDRLVNALSVPGPTPAWLQATLSVAKALGLYDDAGKFAAHASDLHALTQGNWLALLDSGKRAGAVSSLVTLVDGLGLPGTVSASGTVVNWTFPAGGGQVGLAAGWDGAGPLLRVHVYGMKPADAPVRLDASLGYAAGDIECIVGARLSLASALGIAVEPAVSIGLDTGGRFSVKVHPLATGGSTPADGPLEIAIAPSPAVSVASGGAEQVVTHLVLPLAVQSLYASLKAQLDRHLWSGGPTLRDALGFARLIDTATDALKLPLPDAMDMVSGLLSGVAASAGIARVDITPNLHLQFTGDGSKLGMRLSGQQDFDAGDYKLSLRFGAPGNWSPPPAPGRAKADDGIALLLFDTTAGIRIAPELLVAGLGFGIAGRDTPLIDTSFLRVGGVTGYVFFDLNVAPGLSIGSFGAGLDLQQFGIPLGMATGGNVGGNNPVAANLLKSDGGSASRPGDTQPVNPAADVEFWYWDAPKGDAQLHVRVGGESGAVWIGVHAGFGPIYIDQVGIAFDDQRAGLLIDGGVSIAGFTAQVDDLTVMVPYRNASDPSKWTLDLKGLALGYSNPAVSIAGGLVKFDGPPIEYDGMLLIKISQIGMVAVGSYSTPTEAGGEQYTSVAIFAGVFVPIGITPIIKISALGLGVGYNRQILVPADLNRIPDFALIKALDRPEDFANDPMGTLNDFRQQFPARRGSLWIAVGLRGTSFEIVNVTAVLYVALDRGVEVGLLGVARMALPADDAAIVSIELALKARFSSAEGLFSIQAQLTDNSWLLSPDCQLTGGYAYFVWFKKSQFLLSMGGYHPAFKPLPEYPVVPRLGYHWDFLGVVHLKGESYFALTNTCVMAGTRMEAAYGPDWLQLWFTAYADFLMSWDPFFYDVSVGISVGARLRIEICFFGCVTISISVSVGARLRLQGPPLHGTATIDLGVCSVTVPFGPTPRQDKERILWPAFRDKYLLNGDPNGNAFQAHITEGLLPPDPPGGEIAPGTADAPWKIAAEWAFQTGSNMPAKGFAFQTDDPRNEADLPNNAIGKFATLSRVYDFDINPMGREAHDVGALHRVVIEKWNPKTQTASVQVLDPDRIKVAPIYAQVSEATYHYFPGEPPAAANTLPALMGLDFWGFAESRNQSKPIDIRHLVDESNSRPLPFATLDVSRIGQLIAFGEAAVKLARVADGASSPRILGVAGQMLSGTQGVFADARVNVGLPRAGLVPVAAEALAKRRSAPPLVTPLSTGLTLEAPAQSPPPVIEPAPQPLPAFVDSLRLRAIMTARATPTAALPVRMRTTVSTGLQQRVRATAAAAAPIARVAAPRPAAIVGAQLRRVPEVQAPRPTQRAAAGRTLLNAQLGHTPGPQHQQDFAVAEKAMAGDGVVLPAGSTHLWDVAPGAARVVLLEGAAAARVTMLSRGGHVINDVEFVVTRSRKVELPDACAMLAVTCLGQIADALQLPIAGAPGAFGAAAFQFAPSGAQPIVGWQSASEVQQVGPRSFLARGSTLEISAGATSVKRGQASGCGVVTLSTLLAAQTAVETRLPGRASVLAVALDVNDACAADEGDLALAIDGLSAAQEPLLVAGGRRRLWLYDLTNAASRVPPPWFTVAVASRSGSRVAGVMAMAGSAQEWAVRMNGQVPPNLVADGAITPYGEVRVRLVRQAGGNDGRG